MNQKYIIIILAILFSFSCGRSDKRGAMMRRRSSVYTETSSARSFSNNKKMRVRKEFQEDFSGNYKMNTEEYDSVKENEILSVANKPLSTFSVDVDTASYSNMRRFLNANRKPPLGAIRTEELINYFDYNYPPPKDDKPFAVHTEMAITPWNSEHLLLKIGIKGKAIEKNRIPLNLVFLLDVSGSMNDENKLPL